MNNSSTVQASPQTSLKTSWTIVHCIAAIVIVTTNSLTIASFRRLPVAGRARAHIFLINLAVADLFVGLLAIPMYLLRLASLVSSYPFVIVDMTLGLASIFTLTIVALERLYAVFRPFRLRQIPTKTYIKSLLLLWIATTLPVTAFVLYRRGLVPFSSFHSIIAAFLFAPLSVTCLAYSFLWIKVKLRPFPDTGAKRDRQLAITLLIATVIFLATWLPYSILYFSSYYQPTLTYSILRMFPDEAVKLIQYSNSFVNPIIYCFRIPDFRRAMYLIVSCRKANRNQREINLTHLKYPTSTTLVKTGAFNLTLHREELHVRKDVMQKGLTQSTLELVQYKYVQD